MNITSKIFIVFALMCVNAAAAYSQDCSSYLRQATELRSQEKYCEALSYYRRYSNCNADADVSTEIAMCERFCRINAMEGIEDPIVETRELDNSRLSDNRTVQPPVPSVSKNAKFKLGFYGGILYPTGKKVQGSKTYLSGGGGINVEYLATPHIGIGLNAGYYACTIESSGSKLTSSLIPVALTSRFYLSTKSIQPYAGFDVGLYTIGGKIEYQGESDSDSKSYFGLAPVLGFQFKLSNAVALDINAKYNCIFIENSTGYNLSPNLGLVFNF